MSHEKVSGKSLQVNAFNVAPGVWGIRHLLVNIYLIHNPDDNSWVLVDAGLKTSASKIRKVAEHLFWPNTAPTSIILTHAHFDHTGSLHTLAEEWDVPIYAHYMEGPYLTGKSSYPPPDPSVGGGMMSTMAWAYPKGPIDVGQRLKYLPEDGSAPGLPGWKYIHTPGHAPGHISLFREEDRVLIAGDAFVTTRPESMMYIMTQKKEIHGPPKYFTYNWASAKQSVKTLAALDPDVAATGHGKPMRGDELRRSLHNLANHFEEQAVPAHGRYVKEPAMVNADGVQYLPPSNSYGLLFKIAGITAAAIVGIILAKNYPKKKKQLFTFSAN